jgi:integrase
MFLLKRKGIFYVEYLDVEENRVRRVSTSQRIKREALKFLTEFENHLKTKKSFKHIFLDDYQKQYAEYIKTNLSAKYHTTVKLSFKQLIDYTGNIPLSKLNYSLLDKFFTETHNRTQQGAWTYYRVLKSAFNKAILWGYIQQNPLQKIKLSKLPEKANLYISEIEFNSILDKTENQTLKDVFLFAYNTGMRLAEITNLKWSSVSFNEGIIKIENTDTFTTKSKKSRIIPINSILFEVFQRRLPKVMDITKNIYVFAKNGVKFNNDYISKQFKKSVRSAKLNDEYHLHILRSSFISNLAKRNVPLSAIQKIVGHENIRVTEKHYLTVQKETLIRAMETLEVNNRPENLRNAVELLN